MDWVNNNFFLLLLDNSVIMSVFHSYSRIMAITRSDELRHPPAARDTKSSSGVIAIIIRSVNNILLLFGYVIISCK
jgi:hypothetical protein